MTGFIVVGEPARKLAEHALGVRNRGASHVVALNPHERLGHAVGLQALTLSLGNECSRNVGAENSLTGTLARGSEAHPDQRAFPSSLTIPADEDRTGAARVVQLGELMMILDLHRQGLSITAIVDAVTKILKEPATETEELQEALHPFTFPSYPESFQGTDEHMTQALINDPHVQRARRVMDGLKNDPPRRSNAQP